MSPEGKENTNFIVVFAVLGLFLVPLVEAVGLHKSKVLDYDAPATSYENIWYALSRGQFKSRSSHAN